MACIYPKGMVSRICKGSFILVFVSINLLKGANLMYFSLAPCCQSYRVNVEASVAHFPMNIFSALKGSVLFLFAITAAGVVPCGGPSNYNQSLPVHH